MYEIEGPHSHDVAAMWVTIAVGSGCSIAFLTYRSSRPAR